MFRSEAVYYLVLQAAKCEREGKHEEARKLLAQAAQMSPKN